MSPLQSSPPPDFLKLLASPLLTLPLPANFDRAVEAPHLKLLWNASPPLRALKLEKFIHAGGSGMVFRAVDRIDQRIVAVKIARAHLFQPPAHRYSPRLPPVAPQEIRALRVLIHQNITTFRGVLSDRGTVFAIVTDYVDRPQPLDQYLVTTLSRQPRLAAAKKMTRLDPTRLDAACAFLIERFTEIADALRYMHSLSLYHCDIKPANLLVDQHSRIVLTDFGSCVHTGDADEKGRVRVEFTWTYAHPDLTDLIAEPRHISGGGLRVSALAPVDKGLARLDLFALARTIQETLAQLVREFGERCYASYNFRYLHIIAALLLDGHVAASKEQTRLTDGRRFVKDAPLDYPEDLFASKKLQTAADVVERLQRFAVRAWPRHEVPELNRWSADVINTGMGDAVPFPPRVAAVFNHPAMTRLQAELQLGWIAKIYSGAQHHRWAHSVGVFSAIAESYAALVADPDVPTARILLTPGDIEHALVAAMVHDIGETSLSHEFESAAPGFYKHDGLVRRLLNESAWGTPTLADVISQQWPRVDVERVLAILDTTQELHDPVDGLARDLVNGPIDADKLDYLTRDSHFCGVPYGRGIDRERFLRALSIDALHSVLAPRLALAYRTKGAASVEALLLARYQIFGAVYWHHTFRCLQALLAYIISRLLTKADGAVSVRGVATPVSVLRDFFYYRVVCALSLSHCKKLIGDPITPMPELFGEPPEALRRERALEFLWKLSDDGLRDFGKVLLDRRLLFRRVYEMRTGDLGQHADYTALATMLAPPLREPLMSRLKDKLLDAIHKKIQQYGPAESEAESEARDRYASLAKTDRPLVILDYPTRGIPDERNFPRAIGDPARKYIAGGAVAPTESDIFHSVRRLQIAIAPLRIFAARDLHELIVRYLDPPDVEACVHSAMPALALPGHRM